MIMIMSGYLGAVSVVTTVKWFWFVIAMCLFVPVRPAYLRLVNPWILTTVLPFCIEKLAETRVVRRRGERC